MAELTVPEQAATDAFEKWRNRPGRADPKLVMEALLDAATRAHSAAPAEKPATRRTKGED